VNHLPWLVLMLMSRLMLALPTVVLDALMMAPWLLKHAVDWLDVAWLIA
jgi:hypothetical protein